MKIMLIQDVTQGVTQDDTPDIHPRELEAHRNEQKTNDQQKIGGTKNGNIRCIGHHAGSDRDGERVGDHRDQSRPHQHPGPPRLRHPPRVRGQEPGTTPRARGQEPGTNLARGSQMARGTGGGAGRTGTHRQNETCVINFIV